MKTNFWHRVRRRHVVRAVTYVTALVLVLAIAVAVTQTRAAQYQMYVENDHQHAFSELVSALEGIDDALQKGALATSPALVTSICTDIYGKVGVASISLGQLPFSSVELENTAGFISRVGDYVLALSKAAAMGSTTGQQQQENLRALSDTASILAQNLSDMQSDIYQGKLTLEELEQAGNLMYTEENQIPSASDSVKLIESEFPEIPTLIYDGPFSQHLEAKNPTMLAGQEELSQDAVVEKIAEFFDLRPEAFELAGTSEGDIPTYFFTARVDGGEMYVEASRQGGMVLAMLNSRTVSQARLSVEAGLERAEKFLSERGIGSMVRSYHQLVDNILVVNFAYQQDGIICYPDLIKVSVALDTGRIVGYEAMGYLSSHTERTLPAATVTEQQAAEKLSSELQVLSHQMAVIPSAGGEEMLCHEFKCSLEDGRHYILYVNALSGNEEKILILIEDENGTLTI